MAYAATGACGLSAVWILQHIDDAVPVQKGVGRKPSAFPATCTFPPAVKPWIRVAAWPCNTACMVPVK